MRLFSAGIAGLIFGIGLVLSGMTNPAKVLGFLDLTGPWDPSLAFVMAGAIVVGFLAFRRAGRHKTSWLGEPVSLPAATRIDRRLILGSFVFGIGWGLAGYCPGPAIASLLTGGSKAATFIVAMLAGMAVYELLERRGARALRKSGQASRPST
jgi:uncharacterized membrane protein YedE/YeeE